MAASCRFAFAVHILAVLALKPEGGVSSDVLAGSLNTNPVVVRRIMSALREAGLICCAKGAGGGARLCCTPEQVSLDLIYRAVEPGERFAPHPHLPSKRCPVGRQIGQVLDEIFSCAQRAMDAALAERTLADVAAAISADPPPGNAPLSRPQPRKAA